MTVFSCQSLGQEVPGNQVDFFNPGFRNFSSEVRENLLFLQGISAFVQRNVRKLDIEFVSCLTFQMIKQLENCLLVFDNSCEEIYQEKEFVKLAVAGRHRNVHCIFVKHNLFHQSKWSRTIGLNTTHIILFKSPRDLQQIDHFGRQLKKVDFLRETYRKATSEPYGHLLVDLDPKTSEHLRFASIITAPGPGIFHLPSELARQTNLSNERKKRAYTEALAEQKKQERIQKISM